MALEKVIVIDKIEYKYWMVGILKWDKMSNSTLCELMLFEDEATSKVCQQFTIKSVVTDGRRIGLNDFVARAIFQFNGLVNVDKAYESIKTNTKKIVLIKKDKGNDVLSADYFADATDIL